MKIKYLLLITTLLASGPALAEMPRMYFGLAGGVGNVHLDNNTGYFANNTLDYNVYKAKIGLDILPYLGVELHGGVRDGEGDKTLRSFYGAFVRGNLPFKDVNVYALAGGGYLTSHFIKKGSDSVNDNLSTVAYGAGIELFGAPNTAVSLEWVRYNQGKIKEVNGISLPTKVDSSFDTWTIGFVHHFGAPRFR
ncbi:MAG: outer membrane beta-barrel protein [Gammaproteobacteria bacterium]|jgi:hypothetical protein